MALTWSVLSVLVAPAMAQDALTPLVPMYGIAQDSFFLGTWMNGYQHRLRTDETGMTRRGTPVMTPWEFLDRLDVTTMRMQAEPYIEQIVDELNETAGAEHRIILSHLGTNFTALPANYRNRFWYTETGYAMNIVLYPWNEVDQPSWPSKFMTISGTTVETSEHSDPAGGRHGVPSRERILNASNTARGQIVASDVVFDWAPRQVNRFKYDASVHDSTVQNASWPFETYNTRTTFSSTTLWHFVVRLRLPQPLPNDVVPPDSAVLRLHLYWERRGETIGQHCSSYVVTKAQATYANSNLYRDIVFDADLAHCGPGLGPLNDTSSSRRINLAVEWAGNEEVALRSISIRAAPAQWLKDSTTTEGADLNDGMRDHLLRMLYGESRVINLQNRRPVIAVAAGIEHAPAEADGYSSMRHFLSRNFRDVSDPGQYLPPWTEDGDQFALDRVDDSLQCFTVETGVNGADFQYGNVGDSVEGVQPAVREHNGGRFQRSGLRFRRIPELALTADSVEAYERSLQRIGFGGHYAPVGLWQPHPLVPSGRLTAYTPGVSFLTRLGRTAELARDRNRRLIFVLFNVTAFGFSRAEVGGQTILDTLIGRIPEAAELRALANLALAYSARGLHHQIATSASNIIDTLPDPPAGLPIGYNDNWGFGPGPNDQQDHFRSFGVFHPDRNGEYADEDPHYAIGRFFAGWGTRFRETQRINRWIRSRVGPHLMKLRWRDGYSINFTVPQTWAMRYAWIRYPDCTGDSCWLSRYDSVGYRPIDSSEIFSSVTARKPGAAADDPAEATYVEMGLFYPRTDSLVVGYDTSRKVAARIHHLFVVNRRCFEPGDDAWLAMTDEPAERAADSLLWLRRRDTMTALAETRRISIHLNLPDSGQYRLARVQELGSDTTRLPGTTQPRVPLDTVLYARGTVNITLRPGGGALLKITELPPADRLHEGSMAYSNQRKILFDGLRYHATYQRPDTTDPLRLFDTILYARSYPMSDTIGSIQWEPVEYTVSTFLDSLGAPATLYANRHPSISLRTQGGDTVITVVWSAMDDESHFDRRKVVLRTIHSATGSAPASLSPTIELVGTYVGYLDSEWGTPVVARLDGGEMVAYSDSLSGIVARFRQVGTGSQWWTSNGGWSAPMSVTPEPASPFKGKLPSMPTFAHVQGRDSNVAVVWQQPYPGRTDILYKRLWHNPGLTLFQTPTLKLNVVSGQHCHPSIDQIQDPWRECQEITTWEGRTAGSITQAIYSRATFTDNRATWDYDSVGTSGAFYEVVLHGRKNLAADAWPNISAIFARDLANPPVRHPITSVSFNGYYSSSDSTMYEARVDYYLSTFTGLKTYTCGGRYQNGSACQDSGLGQQYRHVVLYRSTQPQNPLLTTREYFLPRSRPTAYVADGRYLAIALNDSTGSQLAVRVHDIWYADDANSSPLPLAPRPAQLGRVDSLAQLNALLRSASFAGHDSTLISVQIGGRFAGDTLGWSRARLTVVVDLIDSARQLSVARLDSFVVTTVDTSEQTVERTLDLLSGRYYVRVSIDTAGFVPVSSATQEPYRLGVITEFVPSSLGKLARSGPAVGADARVSVQPNPSARTAEVRFSVRDAQHVRVRLTDLWGKDIRVLLDETDLAAGRYALPVDVSGLAPGAYLVEVITDRSSAHCKLAVPAM